MGLELVLQEAPHTGATIDVYTSGLARMYTGIGGSPNGPPAWMMDPMQQPQNNWMPDYGPSGMQGFNTPGGFQTTLPQYIQFEPIKLPEIEIVPYRRGMELDGGLNLYGNESTAILNDPDTGLDIHHHNYGGGALNFGNDRIIDEFAWLKKRIFDP